MSPHPHNPTPPRPSMSAPTPSSARLPLLDAMRGVALLGVSNQCFYPIPKVQSAVVILELKKPPEVSDQEAFFKMTRQAFSKRRKMLRASLKDLYPSDQITTALQKIGFRVESRPEDLSLDNWLALFAALN